MNQKKKPYRKIAYEKILDLLISSALSVDEPISERSLAKRLGLGRTPVREALKDLAREGILDIIPMRGTFVHKFTLEDVQEIFEVRQGLEGVAAYLAAERGPVEMIYDCAKLLKELSKEPHIDVVKSQEVGWDVHTAIFLSARNNRLLTIYNALHAQSGLALNKIIRDPTERAKATIDEHLGIIKAVITGNPIEAQRRMWIHLGNAFRARLGMLASLGSIADTYK